MVGSSCVRDDKTGAGVRLGGPGPKGLCWGVVQESDDQFRETNGADALDRVNGSGGVAAAGLRRRRSCWVLGGLSGGIGGMGVRGKGGLRFTAIDQPLIFALVFLGVDPRILVSDVLEA
jgi:hypothetical protein